jgi:membrane protein required for colicin V production
MAPGEAAVEAISAVDVAALAILGLAVLRGLWIGLIREVFSLAGLAAACVAVRFGTAPAADWLLLELPAEISPLAARIAAGVLIAVAVILCTAVVGRLVRRGARWAGLGFADRLGGGALGAAEGALVIVVLMLLGIAVVGRDHPALADTRTLAAFESAERLANGTNAGLPAVALPPPADSET